jgi:hypothetical protein
MKQLSGLLIGMMISASCFGAEQQRITVAELKLGGVAIGQTEAQVVALRGSPMKRSETGEGVLFSYSGLEVLVGVGNYGVVEVQSTGEKECTPRHVCPGMSEQVAFSAYGNPIVANREAGTFLEFVPNGSTCWLQAKAEHGVIRSLRIACQP